MDAKNQLSDQLRSAVQRSFPDLQVEKVCERLSTVRSDWTKQAILILADGDYAKLCELIELDELDYREIPSRVNPGAFQGLPADELVRRRTKLGLSLPQTHEEIVVERRRAEVFGFVAKELIVPVDRLTESTQLQINLGLAGEDGDIFVRAFAGRFNVDLDAYNPQHHFAPKPGDNLWVDVKAMLFGQVQRPLIAIKIRDLLLSAAAHRWTVEVEVPT